MALWRGPEVERATREGVGLSGTVMGQWVLRGTWGVPSTAFAAKSAPPPPPTDHAAAMEGHARAEGGG